MALLVLVSALSAHAQDATPSPEPERKVVFMSRTAFHMAAEHLSGDDPRYVGDADFGGELDVVDYGSGRFRVEANYQVVLGEEIRSFDPNQGNYILAGYVSARTRMFEVAGELYHQSRHLADRPKEEAIDWNMLGLRALRRFSYRQAVLDARRAAGRVFL